ncbi:Rhodanese-like protein [Basidiobolus meristosporus CBS 931.73]|uniref:Rhodanese-like protein n=1 Tax=Basidiobolus meristosporus CBS 931.73 TaxID=1314790 RepID=A0A1Y1Y4U9_9FUNG|nr:Rhodanese-like protein [Basidiobolus meristosporus CBS 931.73]|eukprot:ORX92756.1 Rhodanese-like protein [Basidiobolus meristosporus CBS 931.73]
MSSTIPYAGSEELEEILLNKSLTPGKDYLVVDVRDEDFKNGNIPNAINVPAHEVADRANELVEKYSKVPKVFFHCALSQVRGPKSARIYNEALQESGNNHNQEVLVLRGGFTDWQLKYKLRPELLENYNSTYWSNVDFY